MATATELKALFETGDILLQSSFVALIDSVHPSVVTLGTFTGSTIADDSTVLAALQSLETAIEAVPADSNTDFHTETKTADFTATPGKIYLVSLAAGDVIATVPVAAGACSIVVMESGETTGGEGSGASTTPNILTVAGTSVALTDAGQRVDIQCDGTNTVFQHVGYGMESIADDATVATLIARLVAAGLIQLEPEA